MKKRYVIGMFIGSVLFCSCAKDSALGPDVALERDYVLPQGKSPQADGRIVDLYEKYGSYFLYDFTLLDLNWNQVANSTSYKLLWVIRLMREICWICWARCGCSFTRKSS